MTKKISCVVLLCVALCAAPAGFAQNAKPDAEGHAWWQYAVFYEV